MKLLEADLSNLNKNFAKLKKDTALNIFADPDGNDQLFVVNKLKMIFSKSNLPVVGLSIQIDSLSPEKSSSSFDLGFIKNSWFGRLYANRLKNIPFFRRLIIAGFRVFYFIYIEAKSSYQYFTDHQKKTMPLVKLQDYVLQRTLPTTKIFNMEIIHAPGLDIIPKDKHLSLYSLILTERGNDFPPVYVAELENSKAQGGTNLIFTEDSVVCHDLYNFKHDYTSEELHGRHIINLRKNRLARLQQDQGIVELAAAATFCDACAHNYAHWLTEVLPRIAAFCTLEEHKQVPIIVDEGLHPNILQSLAYVVGSERQVYALPVGSGLRVEKLFLTSVAGYIPFQVRKNRAIANSKFSSMALAKVRETMLSCCVDISANELPKKIYLHRTKGGRQVTNFGQIEPILLENDFAIVDANNLSFLQQVLLISNATHVVGPSGAACANIIFSNPKAKIAIIMPKLSDQSPYIGIYSYWNDIRYAATNEGVSYMLSDTSVKGDIHSDLLINCDEFEMALKCMLSS
mgnify:CR=1 FL=1